MSRLSICLFGPPTLVLDGQQVLLDRWKALALLAYLAVEERPHRRDGLATLFWPELSQSQARNGLRRTLNALKHALGDQWLDVTRETVQIRQTANLTVDVWQFRACRASRKPAPMPRRRLRWRQRSRSIGPISWPSFPCATPPPSRTGATSLPRNCAKSWPAPLTRCYGRSARPASWRLPCRRPGAGWRWIHWKRTHTAA